MLTMLFDADAAVQVMSAALPSARDGAVKDSALILEALEALEAGGTDGRLMAALHGLFADAAEGDGSVDVAAVVRAYRT
ncbi:hypothetical protein APASM_3749 [Actinosynnema pretiosum subsp. pretiosum]|nr:hypothetical protein APASM_3749 [Actinosynnema pretiosum subsp. pretiosum]